MKPPLFDYQAPSSIDEAIVALNDVEGAMILAGGQSLIPAMNMRLANPSRLVDIRRIPDLRRISVADGIIRIGAMARHRDVELDDDVHAANPLIREMQAHVAHVPIRHRGTFVGSICHADAAAEMPLLMVLAGGSVVARGPEGERRIAARDFFTFHMTTARKAGEIVTEAHVPALPEGAGWAFEEFTRRHGDYAISAVGAIVTTSAGGAIKDIALAACGISSKPVRLEAAEAVLRGRKPTAADLKEAGAAAADMVTAPDDMHATNAYRKHLTAALLARACGRALARAA
jgi:carbon-monoxide dehydrogenase medium subunit